MNAGQDQEAEKPLRGFPAVHAVGHEGVPLHLSPRHFLRLFTFHCQNLQCAKRQKTRPRDSRSKRDKRTVPLSHFKAVQRNESDLIQGSRCFPWLYLHPSRIFS